MDDEHDKLLRLVGRLQCIHDSLRDAIAAADPDDRHVLDLLVIARDSTHRAVMETWTKAPSAGDVT